MASLTPSDQEQQVPTLDASIIPPLDEQDVAVDEGNVIPIDDQESVHPDAITKLENFYPTHVQTNISLILELEDPLRSIYHPHLIAQQSKLETSGYQYTIGTLSVVFPQHETPDVLPASNSVIKSNTVLVDGRHRFHGLKNLARRNNEWKKRTQSLIVTLWTHKSGEPITRLDALSLGALLNELSTSVKAMSFHDRLFASVSVCRSIQTKTEEPPTAGQVTDALEKGHQLGPLKRRQLYRHAQVALKIYQTQSFYNCVMATAKASTKVSLIHITCDALLNVENPVIFQVCMDVLLKRLENQPPGRFDAIRTLFYQRIIEVAKRLERTAIAADITLSDLLDQQVTMSGKLVSFRTVLVSRYRTFATTEKDTYRSHISRVRYISKMADSLPILSTTPPPPAANITKEAITTTRGGTDTNENKDKDDDDEINIDTEIDNENDNIIINADNENGNNNNGKELQTTPKSKQIDNMSSDIESGHSQVKQVNESDSQRNTDQSMTGEDEPVKMRKKLPFMSTSLKRTITPKQKVQSAQKESGNDHDDHIIHEKYNDDEQHVEYDIDNGFNGDSGGKTNNENDKDAMASAGDVGALAEQGPSPLCSRIKRSSFKSRVKETGEESLRKHEILCDNEKIGRDKNKNEDAQEDRNNYNEKDDDTNDGDDEDDKVQEVEFKKLGTRFSARLRGTQNAQNRQLPGIVKKPVSETNNIMSESEFSDVNDVMIVDNVATNVEAMDDRNPNSGHCENGNHGTGGNQAEVDKQTSERKKKKKKIRMPNAIVDHGVVASNLKKQNVTVSKLRNVISKSRQKHSLDVGKKKALNMLRSLKENELTDVMTRLKYDIIPHQAMPNEAEDENIQQCGDYKFDDNAPPFLLDCSQDNSSIAKPTNLDSITIPYKPRALWPNELPECLSNPHIFLQYIHIPLEHRAHYTLQDFNLLCDNHLAVSILATASHLRTTRSVNTVLKTHHRAQCNNHPGKPYQGNYVDSSIIAGKLNTLPAYEYFAERRTELLLQGYTTLVGLADDKHDDIMNVKFPGGQGWHSKLREYYKKNFEVYETERRHYEQVETGTSATNYVPNDAYFDWLAMGYECNETNEGVYSQKATRFISTKAGVMESIEKCFETKWVVEQRAMLDVRVGQCLAALNIHPNFKTHGYMHMMKTGGRWVRHGSNCTREQFHTALPRGTRRDIIENKHHNPGYFVIVTGESDSALWVVPFSHRQVSACSTPIVPLLSKALRAVKIIIPPWSIFIGRGDLFHAAPAFGDVANDNGQLRYYVYILPENIHIPESIYMLRGFNPSTEENEDIDCSDDLIMNCEGENTDSDDDIQVIDDDDLIMNSGGEDTDSDDDNLVIDGKSRSRGADIKKIEKSERASNGNDDENENVSGTRDSRDKGKSGNSHRVRTPPPPRPGGLARLSCRCDRKMRLSTTPPRFSLNEKDCEDANAPATLGEF